jgi:hypothetical protein
MMNLVDLGDDELIPIFQRVDHKTKLNLMLTCKRFENVIGSYLELFGKFELCVKKREPDLTPINSWELELNLVTDNMLRQIKNLRSLKIEKLVESDSS